jgi:hypothetical protein
MKDIHNMECAVCGGDAGRWEQHWNRDTGYGVCAKCVDYVKGKGATDTDILSLYGKEGLNWGKQP